MPDQKANWCSVNKTGSSSSEAVSDSGISSEEEAAMWEFNQAKRKMKLQKLASTHKETEKKRKSVFWQLTVPTWSENIWRGTSDHQKLYQGSRPFVNQWMTEKYDKKQNGQTAENYTVSNWSFCRKQAAGSRKTSHWTTFCQKQLEKLHRWQGRSQSWSCQVPDGGSWEGWPPRLRTVELYKNSSWNW